MRLDGRGGEEHAKEREARALLESIGAGGFTVALDPRGSLLTTEELASALPRWARPRAAFLVGGPLGLHSSALDRADRIWSISPLTFPHELVRVLFAEQIYRAVTILRHVPYHK